MTSPLCEINLGWEEKASSDADEDITVQIASLRSQPPV